MYATIEGNDIKLYGTIWHGDGQWVVSQISKTLAKAKEDVAVHLHTDGGSVFDGNLIYNAIGSAKANVTIYIDGLAASMGAIIMLAAKSIYMAENAYIMIHAPSGSQRGNAKEFESTAKLLRSMEANFIKKLSSRSTLEETAVKDLMNGDNWFSADEALEAGLIDEIVDPVLEESSLSAYQDVKMCAQLFASYNQQPEHETPPKNTNPKPKKMKLSAESLTALGLNTNSTDAEINAAIEAQNKRVSDLEAKSKTEHAAKCEALVARAILEGRILGGEKEAWMTDATSNYDLAERMIAKLPVKKNLIASEREQDDLDEDPKTAERTFLDWIKLDPVGLSEIKEKDPKRYEAIQARK